jgi:uncharacterized protein YlxW (UPF0749 family)
MENNNKLLVKVDLLVSKISELEKQIDTLQNEINLEKKRMNNYLTYHLSMDNISQRRLYTNGPF